MKKLVALVLSALALNSFAGGILPHKGVIGIKGAFSGEKQAVFTYNTERDNKPGVVEIKTYKWTPEGLEPTKDIAAFPPILEVKPGRTYAIKVMSKVKAEAIQKTYRIIVSYREQKDETDTEPKISLPIDISLPIFIKPNVEEVIKLESKQDGKNWLVKNVGNATYKTGKYLVDGVQVEKLTYILPGQEISIEGEKVELGASVE
jgi:P pilus assembly chaperone PapD